MMKFVVVSDRRPKSPSRCALCCKKIEGEYVRERGTRLLYWRGQFKVAVLALEQTAKAS
jgi:hypothetical protein